MERKRFEGHMPVTAEVYPMYDNNSVWGWYINDEQSSICRGQSSTKGLAIARLLEAAKNRNIQLSEINLSPTPETDLTVEVVE